MRVRGVRAAGAAAFLCLALAGAGGAGTSAASPVPSAVPAASAVPAEAAPAIDPRSPGTGPGLRGSPIEILLGVILLGAASAAGTLAWTRLVRRD